MKIVDIECLILDHQFPFVRVYTDEGITGIGECFLRQPQTVKTVIDHTLRLVLLGSDPMDTDLCWHAMYHASSAIDMGGAIYCAIAGLDIALWDIKGKALGLPVYQLLGGKFRDKIPMYASSMRRDMTPVEEARRAVSFVEEGFSSYKLHSAVPGTTDNPADQTVDTVREVRAAVGDGVDILVDVNGAFSTHHALEIGKQLQDLGVFHFEEPRPHFDLDGLAEVADGLEMPVASGENIFNHWQYRDLMQRGRVDIIQPDIIKTAGFTEFRRIAALASAFNKPITFHNIQPTVSAAVHLHACAAFENIPYSQEYNIEPISIRDELPVLKTPLEVKNGFLDVPDGPGLGIELDERMVERLAEV